MITRRQTIASMASLLIASGASAKAPGTLQAFAMRTTAVAGLPLGHWPLDHTSIVGVTSGAQWGCFGRTAAEVPWARLIAQGAGDELWAAEIGGPDGHAGIDIDVTGACQQCANRLLLPAGIDVDRSAGSEIATPIFGKYGLGLDALVIRIEDAAFRVNRQHADRISDDSVHRAVASVSSDSLNEWRAVEGSIERIFKPVLKDKWAGRCSDLRSVYFALFNFREVAYDLYRTQRLTKPQFVAKMAAEATLAINLVVDIIGADDLAKITAAPPAAQAAFVFGGSHD